MPINLGGAAFSLGMNITEFVGKMSSSGAAVAGFAAKTTEGMSKSAKAYQSFSVKSDEIEKKILAQTNAVNQLTQQIASQTDVVKLSRDALNQQSAVVDQSTLSIKKQEDAIKLLIKQEKTWKDNKAKALIGKGTDPAVAAQKAEEAYKRKLKAEQKSLDVLEQSAVVEHQKYTVLQQDLSQATIALGKYDAQMRTQQIALAQVTQQRSALGAGPAKPSDKDIKGASINALATKISAQAEATTTWMNNATKGMERFSRGIRGVSDEYIKQQEKIYQAEAAIKSHNTRIAQAQQAVNSYAVEFEKAAQQEIRRRAQIAEAEGFEREKVASLANEQAKLQSMMASNASTTAIVKQQSKIDALNLSIDRNRAGIEALLILEKKDAAQKDELSKRYDSAKAYVDKLKEATISHGLTLSDAKNKLAQIIEKEQAKSKADKEAAKDEKEAAKALAATKKEQDALAKSLDTTGQKAGILSRIYSGLINSFKSYLQSMNPVKSKLDSVGQSTDQLNTKTVNVTAVFSKLQMTLATITGSAIGTFIGNLASGFQNMAGQALGVYKNNELMQLSLTNMLAAQDRQRDSTLSNADSMKQASGEAIELDKWMKRLAIESPFSQKDIKDGMQLGLSLGFNVEQMQRLTLATTNWAAASGKSGEEMTQVTRALGQMNANGKVTLEDLNQLTNVGIGWSSVLEKEFAPEIAKSGKGLRDLISEGIVPADRAIGALTASFESDFPDGAKQAGDSVTGLLASLGDIKDAALQAGFSSILEGLKPLLKEFTDFFVTGPAIEQIKTFGTMLGGYVTSAVTTFSNLLPGIVSTWNDFSPAIFQAIDSLSEFAKWTYGWGAGLIQEFSQGIMDNVQPIIDAVMEIGNLLSEWLMPHSPPKILPDIDKWGQDTIQLWADGMSKPDMSAISDIGDQVRSILSANGESDIAATVIGSQDTMARAINEFKRLGSVSEATFTQLRMASGSAGDKVEAYARAMFAAQAATAKVTAAQKNLNDITAKYDAILAPLNARLQAFQNKQQGKAIADEMKSLQEQLAFQNPEGMDFDKSGIQARLEELDIQKQINDAEAARDAEMGKAQTILTAAEEEQKKKQDELDLVKEQIDFANKRNDLIKEQNDEILRAAEVTDKATESTKKKNTEEEKAEKLALRVSEAQFKANLEQMTGAERVQALTDRLSELEPGTLAYIATQRDLAKAQDDYNKSLEKQDATMAKLDEKQFNAQLAGMDRADQIDAIENRMKDMTAGTEEYFKWQQKLNSLNMQEDKAREAAEKKALKGSGGKGGKGSKPMLAGSPFKGLTEGKEEITDALDRVKKLTDGVGQASKVAAGYADTVRGFFDKFKVYAPQIGYIMSRFVAGFAVFLAMEKVIKPFLAFVMGIGRFLTPINLLMLALTGIGIIIKEDIGGIQAIMSRAFADIMPLVKNIQDSVQAIINAFKTGNVETIVQSIMSFVPEIIDNIISIGTRIGDAVKEWAKPFIENGQTIFKDGLASVIAFIGTWIASGGLAGLWTNINNFLGSGFDGMSTWMINVGLGYLLGGFSILMLMLTDQIKKNIPGFNEGLVEFGKGIVQKIVDAVVAAVPLFTEGFKLLVESVKAWVDAGGLKDIAGSFSAMFVLLGPAVIAGFGVLVAVITEQITTNLPIIMKQIDTWKNAFVDWMLEVAPRATSGIGMLAGTLVAGLAAFLLRGAVDLIPKILKIGLEWVNVIATMIPGIVKAITSFVAIAAVWIATDGITVLVKGIGKLILVIIDWINTTAPTLFYNIGNLLGDILTKIVGAVVAIAGYWATYGWVLLGEFAIWIANEFLPRIGDAMQSSVKSIVGFVMGFFIGILQPVFDLLSVGTSDAVKNILATFGVTFDQGKVDLIKKIVGIFDSVVNAIKAVLGIASPSTVFTDIGMNVVQSAIDGASSLAQSLLDTFSLMWTTIQLNTVATITNTVTDVTKKWKDFSDDFDKKTTDLKKLIVATINKLKMDVVQAIKTLVEDGIEKVNTFHDTLTTTFDTINTKITTAISGARDVIGTTLEDLVGKVGKAFDDVKKFFTDNQFLNDLANSAKTIGGKIISGIIEGFQGAVQSLKDALLEFLREAVADILSKWTSNNKPKAAPAGPGGTSGGTTFSGNNPLMASGGLAAGGASSSMTAVPGANPFMVQALFAASKNRTPLPAGMGDPTKYDLAAFVQQGGKLDRGLLAQIAERKYTLAGGPTKENPWRVIDYADLEGAHRKINELVDANAGVTTPPSSMMAGDTSSQGNVTNNYNATFRTERDSMGLMNDFNIMKTLRKV